MPAAMSEARRAAFLAALAETGNQRLAAERTKVSASWVRLRRSTDPAFRAAVDAAIAAAKARLARAAGVGPERPWRDQDGEELVVRRACGRFMQVVRARPGEWTPRVEARFLRALKGSCNVQAACRETGVTATAAYYHRQRWPKFAERWDAAIEEGYDRLSGALVASAGAMLGDPDMVPDPVLTVTSVDQALQILQLYRRSVRGEQRLGRRALPKTLDEVRPAIIAQLEMFERALQAEMTPAERAARRAVLARARPGAGGGAAG